MNYTLLDAGEDIKTGQCAIYRSVKKVIVNTGRQLTRQFSCNSPLFFIKTLLLLSQFEDELTTPIRESKSLLWFLIMSTVFQTCLSMFFLKCSLLSHSALSASTSMVFATSYTQKAAHPSMFYSWSSICSHSIILLIGLWTVLCLWQPWAVFTIK